MHSSLFRFFAKRPIRPEFLPMTHTNYNFEQFPEYTQRYSKALQQRELLVKKLEIGKPKAQKRSQIKRDTVLTIENYQVWRVFHTDPDYGHGSGFFTLPNGKITTSPKLLMKTFGHYLPAPSLFAKATACYQFQDRNLDYFYLYDVRKGLPKLRLIKSDLDIARDFWASDEKHEFWFSCSQYAEKYRFKKYILTELDKCEKGEIEGFEERMNEAGFSIEMFVDYEKDYSIKKVPLVYRKKRSEFASFGESKMDFLNDLKYDKPLETPEIFEQQKGLEKY